MSVVNIVVVGGGIAGLWVALKLAKAGYRVILLEAQPCLGAGSSTHHHGWLHHGRFYLLTHGLEVARQCQAGAQEILSLAPHSVEPCHGSYLVTADPDCAHHYVQQCQEFGLPPDEVPVKALHERVPALRGIQAAFAVSDLPFAPSLVLKTLGTAAVEAGVEIRCGAAVQKLCREAERITGVRYQRNGIEETLSADLVVNAAGAWSRSLLQTAGINVPEIRLFESSLLVVKPVLTDCMLLSLDAKGATVVPHGDRTVIGVNGDSQPVEEAGREQRSNPASIDTLIRGAAHLMPGIIGRKLTALVWTCLKVEFVSHTNPRGRSPAYVVLDHSAQGVANLLTAIPGKFTTAPLLATAVLEKVWEKLPLQPRALRVGASRK